MNRDSCAMIGFHMILSRAAGVRKNGCIKTQATRLLIRLRAQAWSSSANYALVPAQAFLGFEAGKTMLTSWNVMLFGLSS